MVRRQFCQCAIDMMVIFHSQDERQRGLMSKNDKMGT